MYGIGTVELNQNAVYKLQIAYRKMFRYISKLSKCARLSELLDVFGIKSIGELIRAKSINVTKQCMESRFSKIVPISLCKLYG